MILNGSTFDLNDSVAVCTLEFVRFAKIPVFAVFDVIRLVRLFMEWVLTPNINQYFNKHHLISVLQNARVPGKRRKEAQEDEDANHYQRDVICPRNQTVK